MSVADRTTLLTGAIVAVVAVLWMTLRHTPNKGNSSPSITTAESVENDAVSLPVQSAVAEEADTVQVQLMIHGVNSDQGILRLAVFDRADGFPDHAQALQRRSVSPKECTEPVPLLLPKAGDYAIAVYHDIDANRRLNRAPLGYPTEPYGFSADARSTFGPPSYDAAAVAVDESGESVNLTIR